MNNLNFNGYYLSAPSHYEDWHGGVKIERQNYNAYYFNEDGTFYKAGKINTTFFTEDDFLVKGSIGEYQVNGNILEYIFDKGSEFEVRQQLTILGVDLLANKNQREYRWTPFPT